MEVDASIPVTFAPRRHSSSEVSIAAADIENAAPFHVAEEFKNESTFDSVRYRADLGRPPRSVSSGSQGTDVGMTLLHWAPAMMGSLKRILLCPRLWD
jgi:hypothetical protein